MIGDILQPTHLLFILVVALLVLGPKRLPEVGRALGRGLRDFRSALNTDELRDQMMSTTSPHSEVPSFGEPAEPSEAPVETDTAATAVMPTPASTPVTTTSPEVAASQEPVASTEPGGSAPAADTVR